MNFIEFWKLKEFYWQASIELRHLLSEGFHSILDCISGSGVSCWIWYEPHHIKTGLKIFVYVIPKEGLADASPTMLSILHFKIELWGCDAELGGRRYALYSSETAKGAGLSRPSCDGGWSEHLYRVGLLSDLTLVLAPWIFKGQFLLLFLILNYGQPKNKMGVLPYIKSLQW